MDSAMELPGCDFVCMDVALHAYFNRGHSYNQILRFLSERHDLDISRSTLKRHLQRLGLRRYGQRSPEAELSIRLREVQEQTDGQAGYRRTWRILCRKYGLHVTQEQVRLALLELHPINVIARTQNALRRRAYYAPGPNYIWHLDGYDKLKPYGFAISGCIDGFSRKIIFLECSTGNNDPAVILKYYLDAIEKFQGCPVLLRTDCGTENSLIAAAHCTLREERCHIYGTSFHNQRIEAWWSVLRKSWTQSWMNLYEDLSSFGILTTTNATQKAVLVFTFMDLIRQELEEFKADWNTHTIRRSPNTLCPNGKPDELYYIPPVGFNEKKKPFNEDRLQNLRMNCSQPNVAISLATHLQCQEYMDNNNLRMPETKDDGTQLYIRLLDHLGALPTIT